MFGKIILIAGVLLVGVFVLKTYGIIRFPDTQCSSYHTATTSAPQNPSSAKDYFDEGNYEYDTGHCLEAVSAYSEAITRDPTYAEAYNNRGYTLMRLRDYKMALSDFDTALSINPDYVTALMNRGDIYNYYYAINRNKAIADYKHVIALGKEKDQSKSVCGHLAMARTGNIVPLAIINMFMLQTDCK